MKQIEAEETSNDYEMTWDNCTGTIYTKDRRWKAYCELTDECDEEDPEPMWFCKTEKVENMWSNFEREFFDVDEFEQAREWCKSKMIEYDEG